MKLIAKKELSVSEINMDNLDPAFRRASVNMVLTTLNCEEILKNIPQNISKDRVSFVVATHFGEVSTTLEFLSTYHETHVPRPILFQNSLHNSTLGFASIHLGLTGPAMTISCDRETESSAMQMCESLLTMTDYALLCLVDSIPQELVNYYVETYPFLKPFVNKSTCYLFGKA